MGEIRMIVKGLIVDPIANMPVVILRDEEGRNFLPIWIGIFEANAIALQLEGISTPRPMTHDLLRDVIALVDAEVVRVVVTDLTDNTYIAGLLIRTTTKEVLVDCRPSDAIALALRTSAPVFVDEAVLEKSRDSNDQEDVRNSERLRKWLEEVDPDTLGKYRM